MSPSGLRALRQIQIGEESSKGTAVPATAVLLGTLTMKSSPTIHRPMEERGQLAEFSRSVKVANLAELSFEGDVTFEQILYLLHMAVLGNVTPTPQAETDWVAETAYVLGDYVENTGTPNGYVYECTVAGTSDTGEPSWPTTPGTTVVDGTVTWTCRVVNTWTFTPAMTAAGVFDSFTIEYGDDIQAWETEFCMARSVEISGAMNEPLKVRGDIFGRKMTPTTFTSALTPPTVESIIAQKGKLYIDAESGTIGTTEKASTLISFSFTINTGLDFKRFADGSVDFSTYRETFKSVDLKMTFAFNSGAETERLNFDGETLRLIRIALEGSPLQTESSGDSVQDNPLTADATTVNVTSGANFAIGQTIKVESEYMYITNIVTNALTVVRGYDDSARTAHVQTTPIYIINKKSLNLDFCGIYTDWATLSERDGEDVVEVTMSTQRGTTYTKLFELAVRNDIKTLP